MTRREQLSRRSLTELEIKVRNNEILRLTATGLYNCTQIAEAYNRSSRLIGRIRAENIEPVNPWMTINECAEYLKVSPSIIAALIDKRYIEATAFDPADSPGTELKGAPIYLAVRMAWLFKNKGRWGSASDAAERAGISKKGMEARARQGRAAHLKAPRGKVFTIDGQSNLRYIFDLQQINQVISAPEETQLEIPLKPKRTDRATRLRAHYQSDLTTDHGTIKCDRELDITVFHTEGKSSKATLIHIGWDEGEENPTVHVVTKVPVTVHRPEC